MQANSPSIRTITEHARRAQIVEAAIQVIAERGYAKASFARIAEQAGLSSTGIISYHFSRKRDLDQEVVATVVGGIGAYMAERMQASSTPANALASYIEGIVSYMQLEGPRMRALASIVLHGGVVWSGERQERATDGLRDVLRWGQEAGEFRPFDIDVMAATIQRSLDGIPFLQMANPDLDLPHYARELVATFTLATQRSG